MTYRNRDLLDLAYELPCTLRFEGCAGGPGEPAHANWMAFGKGKSLKAHDCFFAASCRPCHARLDQGSDLSREERQDAWLRGYIETQVLLWERELIRVA